VPHLPRFRSLPAFGRRPWCVWRGHRGRHPKPITRAADWGQRCGGRSTPDSGPRRRPGWLPARAKTRLPRCKIRGTPPYVNAGNRCSFISELPAGPAVVPPINGSVGAPRPANILKLNLTLGRRTRSPGYWVHLETSNDVCDYSSIVGRRRF
jgi:hypothetical protein